MTEGIGDGVAVSTSGVISRDPAEAVAGLLDIDLPSRESLPPMWHCVYLLPRPRQSDLGADGHPRRGIPTSPEPGAVRMFAGGRVLMHAALRFDAVATRTRRAVKTVERLGTSGPLTFVTVSDEWHQDGVLAMVDEQEIVYRTRAAGVLAKNGPAAEQAIRSGRAQLRFAVDPIVLFRFSALTYNAHRIHYDSAYAISEGYPDLVVHGPLQALLMAEGLRRSGRDLTGTTFSYRLVSPSFGPQTLTVSTEPHGRAIESYVQDGANRVTATATVVPIA